ncbi:MAG: hypothetical protein AAB968_00025, partial [Patescibacteria group bacterium]
RLNSWKRVSKTLTTPSSSTAAREVPSGAPSVTASSSAFSALVSKYYFRNSLRYRRPSHICSLGDA